MTDVDKKIPKITLKPGAPPIEKLTGFLRVDLPYKFHPEYWPEQQATGLSYHHGKKPENVLEAVNEEAAMLASGEVNLAELLEDEDVIIEYVLIDEDGEVWSELEPEEVDMVDCPCGCGDCSTCKPDCGENGRCPDVKCLGQVEPAQA